MSAKTKTEPMLRGHAKHRRTQSDYMGTLLDRVTLETWGEVVDATVARAKDGDAQARAFLAQYLVGKPAHEAPEPLTIAAQRIRGSDPLVSRLAKPAIYRATHSYAAADDALEDAYEAQIAAELPAHIESKD